MSLLLSSFPLGSLSLPNRVVMAPMTRSRALGNVPNALMARYYAQRASAGLVVTEGTAPVPDGLGYARIPGLFSPAQVAGWREVTRAVHDAGGRIVVQLMHVGRIAHAANLPPGARVVAPSAVRAEGTMYTDAAGPQPLPEPEALTAEGVTDARDGFVRAATNALEAGFDGVELHAANGYLLEQFLSPHTNRRDDAWGGDLARRSRFLLETAEHTAQAIGAARLGVRISPYNVFNDMRAHDETHAQAVHVARALSDLGLGYLHVVQSTDPRFAATAQALRQAFAGPLVLNGGFDRESAERALSEGRADLVSFGRPYVSNPDLVARLETGAALATPDPTTFYTPGAEGYVDYAARSA